MKELLIKIRSLFDGGGLTKATEKLGEFGSKVVAAARLLNAAFVGVFVGKMLAKPFEDLNKLTEKAIETQKKFGAAVNETTTATTLDGAIKGYETLTGMASDLLESVESTSQGWGAWLANLVLLGEPLRQAQKISESVMENARSAFLYAVMLQAKDAKAIEEDPSREPGIKRQHDQANELAAIDKMMDQALGCLDVKTVRTLLDAKDFIRERQEAESRTAESKERQQKIDQYNANQSKKDAALNKALHNERSSADALADAKANADGISPKEIERKRRQADEVSAQQDRVSNAEGDAREHEQEALRNIQERQKLDDAAAANAAAAKRAELELELRIAEARAAGDKSLEARLVWQRDYNRLLEEAKAAEMEDPWGYARRGANAAMGKDKKSPVRIFDNGNLQAGTQRAAAAAAMRALAARPPEDSGKKTAENTAKLLMKTDSLIKAVERFTEGAFV